MNLHLTIRQHLGEDANRFDPRHIEAIMRKRNVEPTRLSSDLLQDEIDFSRVVVVALGSDRAEEFAQSCGI